MLWGADRRQTLGEESEAHGEKLRLLRGQPGLPDSGRTPGISLQRGWILFKVGSLVPGAGGGKRKVLKLCCLLMGRRLSLETDRKKKRKPATGLNHPKSQRK